MIKAIIFALLAVSCEAQFRGRITDVDGYPIEWLREPQPGTSRPEALFRPTPTPLRPLSMRVVYRRLEHKIDDDHVITIGGNGLVTGQVHVKLIAPDAADCTAPRHVHRTTGADKTVPQPPKYAGGNTFRQNFELPVDEEYPHEHMMPWICVCQGACPVASENWIHTNMRYAVVPPCDGDNNANRSITNTNTAHLCEVYADTISPVVIFGEINVFPTGVIPPAAWWTPAQPDRAHLLFLERKQRTKCCGWRESGVRDLRGNSLNKRWGVCINPLLENCCSRTGALQLPINQQQGTQQADGGIGKPYSKFREKCCFGGNLTIEAQQENTNRMPYERTPNPTVISYLDDYCPCKLGMQVEMCQQQRPTFPTGAVKPKCCIATKYPELAVKPSVEFAWGKCFDDVSTKCCDTGDIYDPGSMTCCKINGVQTINKPCPCSADSHCSWGAEALFMRCCQDTARPILPTPMENNDLCGIYVNFPNGTGPSENQPCLGHCIDTRWQICCNGASCIDEYEVCCNNTCCNKFNQRCTMGLRGGAPGAPFNRYEFRVPYEVCTSVEGLTPFVAVQAFVVPLFLLIATFISLAATLFFAKRQSTLQPLSTYERSMFALCCVIILFAWPFFFSPLYKYGVVTIWAAFFVMLASLSQLRQLNIAALVVITVLLIYLVDPFYGNEILTLAEDRDAPPINSVHGYSGILSSTAMQILSGQSRCIEWYNFFQRDPKTEDRLRWDNPEKTSFGFCSRGWYVALALFGGILIALTFFLFFVTLVTHIRNILFEKAQKTDDVVGWH